jgi:4-amino-4-deoxy-L-arabinose transferase-like glycosyltransferase
MFRIGTYSGKSFKTMKRTAKVKSPNSKKRTETRKQTQSKASRKFKLDIPSAFIILLFLITASLHMGKYFTTDEFNWFYTWITQYWNAVSSFEFSEIPSTTYPGAFHSFITGFTNFFLDQNEFLQYDKISTYLFWWRFPILLFNSLSLFIIFNLLKKFFNKREAYLILFLIAFTPVIIGMSRIVNSDSVLWNTTLISVLSCILYIREHNKKYVILSGIFMGIAVVSKYNGVVIFFFHILILPVEFLFDKTSKSKLKVQYLNILKIWLIAVLTFTFFFPAALVEPFKYWSRLFRFFALNPAFLSVFILLSADIFIFNSKLLVFFKEKTKNPKYILKVLSAFFIVSLIASVTLKYTDILSVTKHSSEQWKIPFFYSLIENFYGFITTLQVPAVIGLFIFFVQSFLKKHKGKDFSLPFHMIIFILVFLLGVSVQGVKTGHRYIILILPFVSIIAVWAYSMLKVNTKIIYSLIILIIVIDIVLLFPKYYVFYRNTSYDIGQKKIAWSVGAYDLALEMNKNIKDINTKVLADRNSFGLFFKGFTQAMFYDKITDSKIKQYDYLCLSSAGYSQVNRTPPLEDYYETPKDSFLYLKGNDKSGWMGIIKVDKNKPVLKIENTFDPESYIDLSDDWTVSLWIKYNENSENLIYIGENYKTGYDFKIEENCFICRINEDLYIKTDTLSKTEYSNIVIQSYSENDDQYLKITVNNTNEYKTILPEKKQTQEKFFISTIFPGDMNDVRIYNFMLSEEQKKVVYNSGVMTPESELKSEGEVFIPAEHFTHK